MKADQRTVQFSMFSLFCHLFSLLISLLKKAKSFLELNFYFFFGVFFLLSSPLHI